MFKNKQGYLGFLGFLGFLAFRYFEAYDIEYLPYLAFFGYFAYFWIARIGLDVPDERYYEDVKKAKAFAFDMALYMLGLLFVAWMLIPPFREYIVVGVALCFAAVLIIYAARLYRLEEK